MINEITDQFQSTSPCLQRGRFAVIPEEPGGGGGAASGSQTNEQAKLNNRSPSPDWDFDTDVSHKVYLYFCSIIFSKFLPND